MAPRAFLSLLLLLASFGLAEAHRPYFTKRLAIELPTGHGELRLLHGDGIFGPDPVYAIIVDGNGRFIARSYQSYEFLLKCGSVARCQVLDPKRELILEPDSATFRDGLSTNNLSDPEGDLWSSFDFRQKESSWGFSIRLMSEFEKAEYARWDIGDIIPWVISAFFAIAAGLSLAFAGKRAAAS